MKLEKVDNWDDIKGRDLKLEWFSDRCGDPNWALSVRARGGVLGKPWRTRQHTEQFFQISLMKTAARQISAAPELDTSHLFPSSSRGNDEAILSRLCTFSTCLNLVKALKKDFIINSRNIKTSPVLVWWQSEAAPEVTKYEHKPSSGHLVDAWQT